MCAESHPPQKPILNNWTKTSQKLNFTRLVTNQLSQLVSYLNSSVNITHMWVDYHLLDSQKPVEDFFSLKTTIETISKMTLKKSPILVVTVPHTISREQLKMLINIDQTSVVVDSDLKILHIFEACVSTILLDRVYHSPSVNEILNEQPALFCRQQTPKLHISWLMPSINRTSSSELIQKLTVDFRVRVNSFESLSCLIKNLASQSYCTNFVFVDFEIIDSILASNIDVVQCIKTVELIAGAKKHLKVYAAVKNITDVDKIRQLLHNSGIDGLVPTVGYGFDYNDLHTAVCHILSHSCHIPLVVKQKLDVNKRTRKKSTNLSSRQNEIFKLIVEQGASNKVIANRLKITEGAVKSHVGKLLKKFGLRSRTELAALTS